MDGNSRETLIHPRKIGPENGEPPVSKSSPTNHNPGGPKKLEKRRLDTGSTSPNFRRPPTGIRFFHVIIMANHKSSEKRARQTIVRTERNRAEKSRIKTLRKKTLTAVAAGDKESATKASAEFSSAVDKAAKKNVIHPNKAANLKSKTAKAIAGIA